MAYPEFSELWELITVIEAQEMLKSFMIQDWPNQEKSKREKIHRDLHQKAYPKYFNQDNKEATADALANALRGL